ncbi:MAG: Fic family protein [Candidatus Pacearchaeota archaeon]
MSKKTLAKIDNIVSRIHTHPEYSSCISRHFLSHIREEAYSHSSSIELESDEFIGRKDLDDLKRSYVHNLENGRQFLSREGISLYSLEALGRIVEPSAKSRGFRREEIKFGDFYGSQYERIPHEVDNLVWKLNNDISLHPINRAGLAHLEIVRIHPYSDGNGRVARLLQNFCLEQRGYPPAIINASERDVYLGILNSLWREILNNKETNTHYERARNLFYDFIEAKVLESAEMLEEELKSKRLYTINFYNVKNLETIRSIAKALKGLESKKRKPVLANHIKKTGKTASLYVQGDLSNRELDEFLSFFTKKYKLGYSIESITDCWD